MKVDVWRESSTPTKTIDVYIEKSNITAVTTMLKSRGIPFKVLVRDVNALLIEEEESNKKFTFSNGYNYSKYGTWDSVSIG